eukprot:GHVU01025184.1.p3 GENE.GHVU01025184.1~~GHVU01025184.1.p3  ORF type:complete len:103 (-),score=14.24 GHVU01025184.1:346-654(-)
MQLGIVGIDGGASTKRKRNAFVRSAGAAAAAAMGGGTSSVHATAAGSTDRPADEMSWTSCPPTYLWRIPQIGDSSAAAMIRRDAGTRDHFLRRRSRWLKFYV